MLQARRHEAGLAVAAAVLTARGSPVCSFPPTEQLLCGVCGRRFLGRNRKQDLERHMLTHTGEKPYQCPHCPHRTNRNGNLKTHMFAVHRDLHQAPRPHCDKGVLPLPLPGTSASLPTRDLSPKPS